MTVSGFLYKDVLKYILPVGLLFFLFYPLIGNIASDINGVIPAVIIFSFIIGALIERVSPYPFKIFPDIQQVNRTSTWMWQNWNLKQLFYNLNSQDRDYLYLTDSYIHFYYNSGFVILLYFVSIIYLTTKDVICQCNTFFEHKTFFVGGIEAPSWLILTFCIAIFFRLKKLVVREMEFLMCPNGEYEYFGEKLQKDKQQLFVNRIYGVVYKKSFDSSILSPASGVEIELIFHSHTTKTRSDNYGYWAIPIEQNMLGKLISINFPNQINVLGNKKINLGTFEKPYFENTIEI